MRKTFLEQNPFYILEVSPNEKRASIISKAEEKAFFADGNECEEAQAKLLNPEKRLSAELDWFYEISIEKMADIHNCISESKEMGFDNLSGISRLNAILHNFSLLQYDDCFELGYAILEIDEQYNAIDSNDLLSTINNCRKLAGIREVFEDEVDHEFNRKRVQIRQFISEKTTELDEDDYIGFITAIAEKYIVNTDYEGGVVIFDLLNQYEIKMQSQIEAAVDSIGGFIENIKTTYEDVDIKIDLMIEEIKKWNRLVRPLQLQAQASGVSHSVSENLGYDIRGLALFLHNEKGNSKAALKITAAMKDVFSEVDEVAEKYKEDFEALQEITETDSIIKEIEDELAALKTKVEQTSYVASASNVRGLIQQVEKLNEKVKASLASIDVKAQIREAICYTAREAALRLNNNRGQPAPALTIAQALLSEFGDMPTLKTKLSKDVQTLMAEVAAKTRAQEEAERRQKISKISWLIVLGIMAIFIIFSLGKCDGPSSSSSSTSSYEETVDENSATKDTEFIITLDSWGGVGGSNKARVKYGDAMPQCKAPTKDGYIFKGYYSEKNGAGKQYYSSEMSSMATWDRQEDATLYAYWVASPGASGAITENDGVRFSQDASPGDKSYADIVSIEPRVGIGEAYGNTDTILSYTDVVCECKTSGGKTIWLYMSVSDYRDYFDATAKLMPYMAEFETVTYSKARRVRGTARRAEAMCEGLSQDTGEILLEFESIKN